MLIDVLWLAIKLSLVWVLRLHGILSMTMIFNLNLDQESLEYVIFRRETV